MRQNIAFVSIPRQVEGNALHFKLDATGELPAPQKALRHCVQRRRPF